MKVSELIELLEEQDPDAEVILTIQRNWPLEHRLYGVTTREDMMGADEDAKEDDDWEAETPKDASRNDVILVEGEFVRYGSSTAWEVATQ
jgi:hypothetical protein